MNFSHPKTMIRISILIFAALLTHIGYASASEAVEPVLPPKDKQNLHIYLLMGQSNMAGRDARDLPPPLSNPRVIVFHGDGTWSLAKEPLHPVEKRKVSGVGPGIPFALEMLKSAKPDVTIALVPCAVGGTELKRWVKGGDLYKKALAKARKAGASGSICGVLWHQGESDSRKQQDAETYEKRLSQMFGDLRADLGQPTLPIVVGQLGDFVDLKRFPYVATVRKAIKDVAKSVPNVGYVDAKGLKDMGDHLHFSASAQGEMGKGYAAAMRKLTR